MNDENDKLNHKLISIEPISENEIFNYNIDGTEIQEKQLNPNEEFLHLTSKIDFTSLNGKNLNYSCNDYNPLDEESEEKDVATSNITNRLRKYIVNAIEEADALIDIITVAKKGQYILPQQAVKEPDEASQNILNYVASKKVALSESANLMLKSKLRLEASLLTTGTDKVNSFYHELAVLRQEYRIKWYATRLVCDVGLRSVGSIMPLMTNCQIIETKLIDPESEFKYLKVSLMNHQEGEPILRIRYQSNDTKEDLKATFTNLNYLPVARKLHKQYEKLDKAQRVLMYTEIFQTLCWETQRFGYNAMIEENRIIITLENEDKLHIELIILPEEHWHQYNPSDSAANLDLSSGVLGILLSKLLYDELLEKHRLFRAGRANIPHPVGGPVIMNSLKRYRAITWHRPIDNLLSNKMSYNVNFHEIFLMPGLIYCSLVHQAFVKLQVAIDELAASIPGSVYLYSHVQGVQSIFHKSIKLELIAVPYHTIQSQYTIELDALQTYCVQLRLHSDRLKHTINCKSINIALFKKFFVNQILNFKFESIRRIAVEQHNWTLLDMRISHNKKDLSLISGNGDDSCLEIENARIVLLSPSCKNVVKINSRAYLTDDEDLDAGKHYQLFLAHSTIENLRPTLWQNIDFIPLQQMLFKNDLQIIEVILASLN